MNTFWMVFTGSLAAGWSATAAYAEYRRRRRVRRRERYLEGVRFLLDSQNPDGSWGRYERYRPRFGDLVRYSHLLHTTLVALEALAAVFDRPMPPPRR